MASDIVSRLDSAPLSFLVCVAFGGGTLRVRVRVRVSTAAGDRAYIVSDDGEFELPPSIFDDQENKGPKVKEALAKRVNDTKPIEDKVNWPP